MPKYFAIVSVIGRDQTGVVARVSTSLAQSEINIEDIEQRVIHGQFMMDMMVDPTEMRGDLAELISGLDAIGEELGVTIRLSLYRERRPRRSAVLVTREATASARFSAMPPPPATAAKSPSSSATTRTWRRWWRPPATPSTVFPPTTWPPMKRSFWRS